MRVSLEGRSEMAGVLLDRFGKDITIIPKESELFSAVVEVAVSRHFLGWIIALGDGIRITGPEKLVEEMKAETQRLSSLYL